MIRKVITGQITFLYNPIEKASETLSTGAII